MISVVLIGYGNVASHLLRAFSKSDAVTVKQVYNRTKISAQALASVDFTTDIHQLVEADCYILCVSDDAIPSVSEQFVFKNRLVVHSSGAVSMEKLSNRNRKGVFYPLQTFSKDKRVDFKSIPLCIEAADRADLQLLQRLANSISEEVYEISSEAREKLHVAAVFVNNFVNYLYGLGKEILDENNLPFALLKPLINETAHKLTALDPLEAQTGPAKRNDQKTIRKHLELLDNPEHKEIYKLLTQAIQNQHRNT